jgi:uncharacterized protein YjbJ (UPF0337 family)/ElaB/YqjD/DUF883 family membrane-anchored ribosome-binding protein
MAINAQELQGQWTTLRGQVKEKWGQLTEDDLAFQGGNIDQLVGKIQQKTGEGREAIEHFLGDLTKGGSSTVANLAGHAGEYAQQAGQVAQQAGERLREGYGQVAEQARARLEDSVDAVRQNPGQSVAVAFGVGIVAGLVLGLALKSR